MSSIALKSLRCRLGSNHSDLCLHCQRSRERIESLQPLATQPYHRDSTPSANKHRDVCPLQRHRASDKMFAFVDESHQGVRRLRGLFLIQYRHKLRIPAESGGGMRLISGKTSRLRGQLLTEVLSDTCGRSTSGGIDRGSAIALS
jgi:hypothetical protein